MLPILVKTHKVFVITSSLEKMRMFREMGAIPKYGNLDQAHSLTGIAHLANLIVHLAPPNSEGLRDLRTKNLLHALSKNSRLLKLIYVSTSGVYGDCKGDFVDETREPWPSSPRGKRRLDAEQQIRSWAIAHHAQATILRVPGIYAENRLPIERILQRTPALISNEDVYTNHVHADDLARILVLALYRGLPQRILNASDHSELKMGDYFDLVANALKLKKPPRVGFEELITQVSPQMLSFMKESRRLSNQRLSELGFSFQYPTVTDFLKTVKPYQTFEQKELF